ncbi:hypothetical protein B0H19DRAFT_1228907 [Mycena capillaripes]|nr:hypothetical protein B0H19DRAFT_1228907 [Mycena capillaripes]
MSPVSEDVSNSENFVYSTEAVNDCIQCIMMRRRLAKIQLEQYIVGKIARSVLKGRLALNAEILNLIQKLMDKWDRMHTKNVAGYNASNELYTAVGVEYMSTYIAKIDWALKTKIDGYCMYCKPLINNTQGTGFRQKIPLASALSLAISKDFQKVLRGRFSIDSIEDFGTHYPRCLREWDRYLRSLE